MIRPDLTVAEVRRELRIRAEKAVWLIESGALKGYAVPGGKRNQYRVTRQALDDFKAGRTATESAKPEKRRRVSRRADFIQYF